MKVADRIKSFIFVTRNWYNGVPTTELVCLSKAYVQVHHVDDDINVDVSLH